MNAEILCVGTELLLGNVVNTNARDLSEKLAKIGINVFWHTVVGDNPERLVQCVDIARFRADLIITTGGLGPTCDDLTKQILARSFGLELVYHADEAEQLRAVFASRHGERPFTENNLRQVYLPEGCTVFHNDWGTAPGCAFEKGGVHVLMLPGPPGEMNAMFDHCALPYLRSLNDETILSHQLRMFGIGESQMEERLRDLMEGLHNPTLAPYAKPGECLVRVTAKAETAEKCEEMMEPVLEEVRSRVGEYIYGQDVDSMQEMLLALLKERNVTLAAAESCTGGLLAKLLTDLPGASQVFRGGVTVYTEEAKTELLGIKAGYIEEHGVVSAAVATKMAKRVRKRLGSDLGVGITGWAGPDGEQRGLIYVALAWKGESVVRQLHCGSRTPRDRCRVLAVYNAFDMIRRHLNELEI